MPTVLDGEPQLTNLSPRQQRPPQQLPMPSIGRAHSALPDLSTYLIDGDRGMGLLVDVDAQTTTMKWSPS